jgi:hypothetical protein
MAITVNVNSYVSAEDADAYFADRLDVAAWTIAGATEKAQALVTATSMLDGMRWIGVATDDDQKLAFPRIATYLDPRLGKVIELDSLTVPDRIKKATFELAYHLLNNDGLLDDVGKVDTLEISSIQLRSIKAPAKIPSVVYNLYSPLLLNAGSSMWWRAN